jgi:hypothetical protein
MSFYSFTFILYWLSLLFKCYNTSWAWVSMIWTIRLPSIDFCLIQRCSNSTLLKDFYRTLPFHLMEYQKNLVSFSFSWPTPSSNIFHNALHCLSRDTSRSTWTFYHRLEIHSWFSSNEGKGLHIPSAAL